MQCGIVWQHTLWNRPQHNGVAEQENRLITEQITIMLNESGLPKIFWGECLTALVHIWNRCPTKSNEGLTPYQLWHQKKPDILHLCVWGCTADVHSWSTHEEMCLHRVPWWVQRLEILWSNNKVYLHIRVCCFQQKNIWYTKHQMLTSWPQAKSIPRVSRHPRW